MSFTVTILISLTCVPAFAYGWHGDTDSTRYHPVPDVVVEGSRVNMSVVNAVTWLDSALMASLGGHDVADVLRHVPAAMVMQYGGIGGLTTISLRGGSAAQNLVLINGLRLSSALNGMADLALLPAPLVGEIKVIRGGAGALFGANAITGVVDVRLRHYANDTSFVNATATLASFDEYRASAAVGSSVAGGTLSVAVDHRVAAGSYPVAITTPYGVLDVNRINSDVCVSSVVTAWTSNGVSAWMIARDSERGSPGPVLSGRMANVSARMWDRDVMGGLNTQILASGSLYLSLKTGACYREQRYADPEATFRSLRGLDEDFIYREVMGRLEADYDAFEGLHVSSGMELSTADLRGNMLDNSVGSQVSRGSGAMFTHVAWELDRQFTLQAGARFDYLSDAGSAPSTMLGIRWQAVRDAVLRFSVSSNFRPPAFTEMYYLNYGTASLKPEKSISAELGAVIQGYKNDGLVLEAVCFYVSTQDLIISVPVSAMTWSAQNVGRAVSYGVELTTSVALLHPAVRGQVSYTLQDARDRTNRPTFHNTLIPMIPQEILSAAAFWRPSIFELGLSVVSNSYRYGLPGGMANAVLDRFTVITLNGGIHIKGHLMTGTIRLNVENLLDSRYVVVRGYPMPGRLLRLSVNIAR